MLVSYGSDAESDDEPQTAPQIPHSVPTKSTEAVNTSESKPTGGLQLPAPKGKKANRGPVKISLTDVSSADAPAPDAEPAKKRPKLGGFGGGGLASLLPAPKKDTAKPSAEFSGKPVAVEPNSDAGPSQDGEEAKERSAVDAASSATMMMPKSVKRKQPDAAAATATTKAAPVEDMFGLGSVSSSAAPTLSSSTSTSTSNSVKKAFTAAPTVAEKPKQNYYATLPPATPDNPYPGFHCIPQTGQWEPDRPEEWSEWAIMHGWAPSAQQQAEASTSSASQAPRGFEGAELGDVSEISSDQQRADAEASRKAAEAMPSKAAYVDPKEEEEKRLKLARLQGAGRARGKNQLSSLLSNAIGQREELEERIALAKSNKRAGGKKYGF